MTAPIRPHLNAVLCVNCDHPFASHQAATNRCPSAYPVRGWILGQHFLARELWANQAAKAHAKEQEAFLGGKPPHVGGDTFDHPNV